MKLKFAWIYIRYLYFYLTGRCSGYCLVIDGKIFKRTIRHFSHLLMVIETTNDLSEQRQEEYKEIIVMDPWKDFKILYHQYSSVKLRYVGMEKDYGGDPLIRETVRVSHRRRADTSV